MDDDAVLVIDDNPGQLDQRSYQDYVWETYRLRIVVKRSIAEGLRWVREHTNCRATLSDTNGQDDLAHIAQLRELRPGLLIALNTGSMTEEKRARALAVGADACYQKGAGSLDSFFARVAARAKNRLHDDYRAADRRFWADLPALLQDPNRIGRWVAYTPDGLFAEGDDDAALVRSCEAKGLQPGRFVVAPVTPELPPEEVANSWLLSSGLNHDVAVR